jgi:hypothetical protein
MKDLLRIPQVDAVRSGKALASVLARISDSGCESQDG